MDTITIFVAGDSRGNPGPAAIGVRILDARNEVLAEVSESIGNATNNFAEYYAVMRGLQTVEEILGDNTQKVKLEVKLSNEIVKLQLNGEHQIKEPGLVPYFIEIYNMRVSSFPNITFTHISRALNEEAQGLLLKVLGSA